MRVPPGHQIDELALAPGRASATAAFVESWFDRSGGFHSQAVVADLGSRPARSLPSGGQLASDVQIAGNRRGDQVVAWKACDTTPDCSVWAALRQGGGRFGRAIQLGPTDADQDPVVAISPSGLAIVSWIGSGRVVAAWGSVSGGRLTGPRMLSSTGDESAPALGFSPTGQALAVWVQGTVAPQLMGALFR
jgi:hypothetical protein